MSFDRGVANSLWRDLFRGCSVEHLVASHSNHAPILIKLNDNVDVLWGHGVQKRRAFYFERLWADIDGCNDTIWKAWAALVGGNSVDRYQVRLSNTTHCLGS